MAILIDGYDGIEEVARGGFGVVYRARHVQFDRVVAVKVLSQMEADDDAAMRWERECRAMGALSWHPNIVVVYDLGVTDDNHPYLSMEFLDRGSLADRIMAQGPLPWADAVSMIIQVSGALQAAHDAEVLHRDIKPENILVGLYGEAKLTDFGLATGDNTMHTAAGMASFTLAHASPEALAGERVSTSGDVYSLGSTLYHLLAGRAPYVRSTDENLLAAVQRVINDPVPDLRPLGVPDSVAVVIEAAMAKDPAARPQAPAELGRALQRVQQTLGLPVTELRLDPRGGAGAPLVPPPLNDVDQSGATVTVATAGLVPEGVDDSGATITVATAGLVPEGVDASGATVTIATAALAGVAQDAPPVPSVEPAAPPLPPMAPRESAPPATTPPPPGPSATPGGPPAGGPPAGGPPAGGPPAGGPPATADKKRSKAPLLIGLAVIIVLVIVGAVVLASGGDDDGGADVAVGGGGGDDDDDDDGDGGGGEVAGDEVGTVVASITVGATPRGVAVDDGAAWVANREDGTVSRVDTAKDEVSATVDVGEGPRDVAVGLGSVWVTSLEAAEVARLDPADGTVLDTIAFAGGPQAVTTAAGLVWVTDREDSTVVAIDPDSLEQVDEIEVGADPSSVVADGDEFLWVTNREDGTLSKIDLGAGSVADTIDVGDQPAEAAVDGDSVWLASEGTSSVLRIDKASGEVVATIDLGVRVGGVAIDDQGNPWVDGLSALIRIDPASNEVVGQVDIGGELREVAAGEGSLWTVPHDGVILTRVEPG